MGLAPPTLQHSGSQTTPTYKSKPSPKTLSIHIATMAVLSNIIRGPPSTDTRLDQVGKLHMIWRRKNAMYQRDIWDYAAGFCVLMVAFVMNYFIASSLGLTSPCSPEFPVFCLVVNPGACAVALLGAIGLLCWQNYDVLY